MQRIKQNVAPYLTGFVSEAEKVKILDTLQLYNESKKWVVEGQMLAWNGQYSAAEDHYLQALSILSGNANAEYLLMLVHRRKADLIKLVNINSMNVKAIKALGDIYLEERNITEAQKLLSRALSLDPDYTEAIHSLGVTYINIRQLDQALILFRRVLANDRSHGAAAFYAGQCNWQMGKLPAALIYFQLAVDNDPDQAVNHYWLGQALLRSNKRLTAIAEFQRALSINPQYQLALEILAKLR
jgi:tetratricopeptide (TPR) repeat protein